MHITMEIRNKSKRVIEFLSNKLNFELLKKLSLSTLIAILYGLGNANSGMTQEAAKLLPLQNTNAPKVEQVKPPEKATKQSKRKASYLEQIAKLNLLKPPSKVEFSQKTQLNQNKTSFQEVQGRDLQNFVGTVPAGELSKLITDTSTTEVQSVTTSEVRKDTATRTNQIDDLNIAAQALINDGLGYKPIFSNPGTNYHYNPKTRKYDFTAEKTTQHLPILNEEQAHAAISATPEANDLSLNVRGRVSTNEGPLIPEFSKAKTTINQELRVTNSRAMSQQGYNSKSGNFEIQSELRAVSISAPTSTSNPEFSRELNPKTTNNPISALMNATVAIPFSHNLIEAKSEALKVEHQVATDNSFTPKPFSAYPQSIKDEHPKLDQSATKQAASILMNALSNTRPEDETNFSNTKVSVNPMSGDGSGVQLFAGSEMTTDRKISVTKKEGPITDLTLKSQQQYSRGNFKPTEVLINGKNVAIADVDFNFLVQRYNGSYLNTLTRTDIEKYNLTPMIGIKAAYVSSHQNKVNLVVKGQAALLLNPENLQPGFMVSAKMLYQLGSDVGINMSGRYSTQPNYSDPNRLSASLSANLIKGKNGLNVLSFNGGVSYYLDNGAYNALLNAGKPGFDWNATFVLRPTEKLNLSVGYGSNSGVNLGVITQIGNFAPFVQYSTGNGSSNLNAGVKIKLGEQSDLSINYNQYSSKDSFNPGGQSVYVRYNTKF